ncbi:hypothetical protein [Pedobacter insulae]|uniref:hypothetical protein n=1 Tax=Pedobacter insulae TaxID=414048 RepID=UPI001160D0EB|nr:hypothetical protein [Pedobacter insulae]
MFAQKLQFYSSSSIPLYPRFTDLFAGLVSNKTGNGIKADLTFTLSNSTGIVISDSMNDFVIPTGLSRFMPDSLKQLFFARLPHIDTSYLQPGNYTFVMQIITKEATLKNNRKVSIPPFRLLIKQAGIDSLKIETVPALDHLQIYCCRAQVPRFGKRMVKTNCYTAGDTLIKAQFTGDSLIAYQYKIEVYRGTGFIGNTTYKYWDELPDSLSETLSSPETASNKLYGKVRVSADIAIEYNYTNVRYANQLSAPQYTRLYFKPTLTVMGIPLTFNTMLTTESNNNYPVNFFQFGFDAGKFQHSFANNAIKDRMDIEQGLELNKLELDEVNRSLSKFKTTQPGLDYDSNLPDSTSVKHKLKWKRRKKHIEQNDLKFEQLRHKKEALEYARYKDSVYLATRYASDFPGDTLKRFLNKRPDKNLLKTLLAIRSLNVGLCTPHYSEVTLSQIPLQGIHADLRFSRWLVSATVGNRLTFEPPLTNRETYIPRFVNKTYAGKLGWIERRSNSVVYLSFFRFINQPQLINPQAAQNDIASITLETSIFDWMRFTLEGAKSFYQSNAGNYLQNEKYNLIDAWNKDFDNTAFNSAINITAAKNTAFSLSGKLIGSGYFTLGIPFLRNDYLEYSAAWKQFWWLRQIETEFSYMQNRDNLINNKTHSTILTGYGAMLKTHFRTRPNLLIIYKPFNSSASFEENLFNPVNVQPVIITQQFYLFHATVFYNKTLPALSFFKATAATAKKSNLSSSVSFNRSNNQHSTGDIYTLETLTGNLALTDKNTRQMTYNLSLYRSSIVANNAMLHNLAYGTPVLKNRLRLTTGALAQFINDGRKRGGIYTQATGNFKSLSVSTRFNVNYLKGNWFEGNNSFETLVNLFVEWHL